AWGIATADLRCDGKLDLVIANTGTRDVSVLLGNGDGTFQPEMRLPTGLSPERPLIANFNGHPDIVVTDLESNAISVLLGHGDGTFQPEERIPVGSGPLGAVAGDFSGDGRLDLAVANGGSNTVSILLGLGDGTFQPDLTDPRPEETNPSGLAAGDFSGNGILDLATTSYTGHDLFVYRGRGDGTFQKPVVYPVGSTPDSVVVADF